jgi:hypothetical protein
LNILCILSQLTILYIVIIPSLLSSSKKSSVKASS